MFEHYSDQAKSTMLAAKSEACRAGHRAISPEHILLALLRDQSSIDHFIGGRAADNIRGMLLAWMGDRGEEPAVMDVPLSSQARFALAWAATEAEKRHAEVIGNEHLLLGIMHVKNTESARILSENGLTIQGVAARFELRSEPNPPSSPLWRSFLWRANVQPDRDRRLLGKISQLVRRGRSRDALKLLDDFMAEQVNDRPARIKNFAQHAAGIAYGLGDFALTRKYCELDLAHEPNSLLSLCIMAIVSKRQNELELARKFAIRCYRLAAQGHDQLSLTVAEMIRGQFPDLEGLEPGRGS